MEDYQEAYSQAVAAEPRFRGLNYDAFTRDLFARPIYYGDAWVNALQGAGFSARQTVPLCLPLQYQWARENGVRLPPSLASRPLFRWYWQHRYGLTPTCWALLRILDEQIERWQPDLTWIFSGILLNRDQLRRWRAHTERLLLWWSCALDPAMPYEEFDLILSCDPHLVRQLAVRGCRAAYLPQAFDPRVLERVPPVAPRAPKVAFVGNLQTAHAERARFLDALSRHVEVDVFGGGTETLPADSPLRARARDPVWGDDLYRVYGSYLIAFHKQADATPGTAGARRLYEATGMGACLVTELTDDLKDFFEPDREVIAYRSLDECIAKVKHLLAHPAEAAAIGQRAQARTLRDHTYRQRVEQLLDVLKSRTGVSPVTA